MSYVWVLIRTAPNRRTREPETTVVAAYSSRINALEDTRDTIAWLDVDANDWESKQIRGEDRRRRAEVHWLLEMIPFGLRPRRESQMDIGPSPYQDDLSWLDDGPPF